MKLSAVLIVKNEEVMLPRCLSSVKDFDEIIVCDTGSQDNTVAVAKKLGAKVFTDYTWEDDFSKARNHAKKKATGDWILSIDADEALIDQAAVREACLLANKQKVSAVDVRLIAEDNGQWFYYPRLFKNVPEVYWESPIHNTLSIMGTKLGDVRISVGYSPAHNLDPERSLRILLKDVQENFHPRSQFYLGREYWYRRDFENCVITLGRYVQNTTFLAEKADAFLIMARAYWAMSMADDARDACVQALIINPNFKEACLFMADLAGKDSGNPRWEENARQWLQMAKTATNDDVLFVRGEEA